MACNPFANRGGCLCHVQAFVQKCLTTSMLRCCTHRPFTVATVRSTACHAFNGSDSGYQYPKYDSLASEDKTTQVLCCNACVVTEFSSHCDWHNVLFEPKLCRQNYSWTIQGALTPKSVISMHLLPKRVIRGMGGKVGYFWLQAGPTPRPQLSNFCRKCGGPIVMRVPPEETELRNVCSKCSYVDYYNPKLVCQTQTSINQTQ